MAQKAFFSARCVDKAKCGLKSLFFNRLYVHKPGVDKTWTRVDVDNLEMPWGAVGDLFRAVAKGATIYDQLNLL